MKHDIFTSGTRQSTFVFLRQLNILIVAALSLLITGCYTSPPQITPANQTNQTNQTTRTLEPPSSEMPVAATALPEKITISNEPPDVELNNRINKIIEESEFRNARWGVFVVSLKDSRVLMARDAQNLFNPASTQKLLTTAVALDRLGADYRLQTSVMTTKEIEADGTLPSDLTLYGRGAPDFDETELNLLIGQLRQKGLRRVAGNVVGDNSYFRAAALGDGWLWGEAQWYYGAEASALSYDENRVDVRVAGAGRVGEPATVEVVPAVANVVLTNRTNTVEAGTLDAVGVNRGVDNNNLYVWGDIPRDTGFRAQIAVNRPAQWAASEFKKKLEAAGIEVAGEAQSADWRAGRTLDPATVIEIAAVESQPLGEIVREINKESNNLYAELLLRTLGKQFGGEAPDESRRMNRLRGDDAAGAAVVKKWLADKGLSEQETTIHDGSGLSRLNFVSPETMARLLVFAAAMPTAKLFAESLPVAGTDGTLAGRLQNARGRVRAKTGSIAYTGALAGYAETANQETLAFVIFCNNETRQADSRAVIDRIAIEIAEFRGKP